MNQYDNRKFVILAIFLLIGIVFVLRLFYIQVIDDTYMLSAENQSLLKITQYAPRGLIYDRNEELLVYNEAAYDLMVVPKKVKNIDTVKFCELLGIEKEIFISRMQKARKYSYHKESTFEKQLTASTYAEISEKLYMFPGFYGQKRTLRKYPNQIAGHILGYLSEVDERMLTQDPTYRKGDYTGVSGIERTYEKELRGQSGELIYTRDKYNVVQGSYKDGAYDIIAVPGQPLYSTIDSKIQKYGEELMNNKKGTIVAIEPSTGEILALISSPTYDPNLLVGSERTKNYAALAKNDSLNPLFNRALMAKYPPGSIFKIIQALVALQEGAITLNTGFVCAKNLVGCHNHPNAGNVKQAVQFSCNPYFYNVFRRLIQPGKYSNIFKDSEIGLGNWQQHVMSFGLGQPIPIDIYGIKFGSIPGPDLYNRLYGYHRWAFTTIYSVSIGQGEVELVPIQMANLAAIIANKGYYYTPHFIKKIGKTGDKRDIYKEKHYTTIDSSHFSPIIDAMQAVVEEAGGTARKARIDSITVCGKTGTVENPHGEDHSVFMAFAPKENPKIAIAVYVENAGFGGTWAAPISSLIIEKYLKGKIKDSEKEKRILEANFLKPGESKK